MSLIEVISVVTLKRTDTTLDLSQKAKRAGEEKKKKVQKERGFWAYLCPLASGPCDTSGTSAVKRGQVALGRSEWHVIELFKWRGRESWQWRRSMVWRN